MLILMTHVLNQYALQVQGNNYFFLLNLFQRTGKNTDFHRKPISLKSFLKRAKWPVHCVDNTEITIFDYFL